MAKFETADRIFKHPKMLGGNFLGGFNSRLYGDSWAETCAYPNCPSTSGERSAGWYKADAMIERGEIYYRHNFGGPHKPWHNVRVFQDGNAWCVVGENFENLQASDNYAFGDTKEQALANYKDLMERTP